MHDFERPALPLLGSVFLPDQWSGAGHVPPIATKIDHPQLASSFGLVLEPLDVIRRGEGLWAEGVAEAWSAPLGDRDIRAPLRALLAGDAKDWFDGDVPCATEELLLEYGHVRADFALTCPTLIQLIEIKSDRDRLDRLPEQGHAYSRVADVVTLVVGWRHAVAAFRHAPWWWEVWLADPLPAKGVQFVPLRLPSPNPATDRPGLPRLLSRGAALALLAEVGADRGVRSKPRAALHDRLLAAAGPDLLRSRVHAHLKGRARAAVKPSL
jgi:hypothetical protein